MCACAGQAWMVLQMRQRSPLAQDRASAKGDMAAEGVPHRTTVAGPLSSCLARLLVGAAQRKACPPCPGYQVFFLQEELKHASLCLSHREKSNRCKDWKAPVGFIREFTPHRTAMWEAKYIQKTASWAWNQTIGIIKSKFFFFFNI